MCRLLPIFTLHIPSFSSQKKSTFIVHILTFFCCCRFAINVIIFHEALQFKEILILCYNKNFFSRMNARIPPPFTWHICCIIVYSFCPIVLARILNQFRGHWLLNDTLNFAISMSLKFMDQIDFSTFDNLIKKDGNVVYELSCLASKIIRNLFRF